MGRVQDQINGARRSLADRWVKWTSGTVGTLTIVGILGGVAVWLGDSRWLSIADAEETYQTLQEDVESLKGDVALLTEVMLTDAVIDLRIQIEYLDDRARNDQLDESGKRDLQKKKLLLQKYEDRLQQLNHEVD